jgi:hypothetical protein
MSAIAIHIRPGACQGPPGGTLAGRWCVVTVLTQFKAIEARRKANEVSYA